MNQKRSVRVQSIEFGKGSRKKATASSTVTANRGRLHKNSSNLRDTSVRVDQDTATALGRETQDHLIISPLGSSNPTQPTVSAQPSRLSLLSTNQRAFLQQRASSLSVNQSERDELSETCIARLTEEMARIRSRKTITDTQRQSLLKDALRLSPGTSTYEKVARQHAHSEKHRREEKRMFHIRLKQERRRRGQIQRGRRSYCYDLNTSEQPDKNEEMEVYGDGMSYLHQSVSPAWQLEDDTCSPFPIHSEALPSSPSLEFHGCFFTAEDSVILDGEDDNEEEEESDTPEAHDATTDLGAPLLASNLIRDGEGSLESSISEADLQKAYDEITRVRLRMIERAGGMPPAGGLPGDGPAGLVASGRSNDDTTRDSNSNSNSYSTSSSRKKASLDTDVMDIDGNDNNTTTTSSSSNDKSTGNRKREERQVLPLNLTSSPEKGSMRTRVQLVETPNHSKQYSRQHPRREVELRQSEGFPRHTAVQPSTNTDNYDNTSSVEHTQDGRRERRKSDATGGGGGGGGSGWYFNNPMLDNIIRDQSPEYHRRSYPHINNNTPPSLPQHRNSSNLRDNSHNHDRSSKKGMRVEQRYVSPERHMLLLNLDSALDSLAAHYSTSNCNGSSGGGGGSSNLHKDAPSLGRPQSTACLYRDVSKSLMSPILEGKERSLGRPRTTMSHSSMDHTGSTGGCNRHDGNGGNGNDDGGASTIRTPPPSTTSSHPPPSGTPASPGGGLQGKSAQLRSAKTRLLRQQAVDNILFDSTDSNIHNPNPNPSDAHNNSSASASSRDITTPMTTEEPDESFLQALQLAAQAGDAIGKLLKDSRPPSTCTPLQ